MEVKHLIQNALTSAGVFSLPLIDLNQALNDLPWVPEKVCFEARNKLISSVSSLVISPFQGNHISLVTSYPQIKAVLECYAFILQVETFSNLFILLLNPYKCTLHFK